MPTDYIFVYGTLRKATASDMHFTLARYCEYVAAGTIQGKLYEVEGYPGVVESDSTRHQVIGELYRIIDAAQALPELDDYEECTSNYPTPHEYTRKILPVTLNDGSEVLAWVYIYNDDVSPLTQITSGDYLDFIQPDD